MHGFLLIDKPAGWTSHDVVAKLRGMLRQRRIGHGGTLDPFATGLLVVGVGRATRLLQYAQAGNKRYLAHVVLGASTSTDDVDGELLESRQPEPWPELTAVASCASSFVGWIEQRPPSYSAVRVGGERMYARRRRGENVEAPTRSVQISSIEVVDYRPPDLLLDVECGSGTYIRSIARDLGEQLGTEAYCHGLRRTASGSFSVHDASTLTALSALDLPASWNGVALHPDSVVLDLPALLLSEEQTAAWYHGRPAEVSDDIATGDVRVYGSDGRFAGIAEVQTGTARPKMVFTLD